MKNIRKTTPHQKSQKTAISDQEQWQKLREKIYIIRGQQVMLDRDLAVLYGVETKILNKSVGRNLTRFPENFRFQLTKIEHDNLILRFNFGTSSLRHGGSRYLPYAFTEQGVAMLSAVLRSKTAVQISVQIMMLLCKCVNFYPPII